MIGGEQCSPLIGGEQCSPLIGPQFAVFGFRLSSDQRYVVSVSNKIITFDVTTGDMSRVVYPANVEGLMMDMDIRSKDINQ